jgi:hypothetical protein
VICWRGGEWAVGPSLPIVDDMGCFSLGAKAMRDGDLLDLGTISPVSFDGGPSEYGSMMIRASLLQY